MSLYFHSAKKLFLVFFIFVAAILVSRWNDGKLFQGSVFEEGGDNLEQNFGDSAVAMSGNLKIDRFFPPRNLSFANWKGDVVEYPFFQRSRTFVPRFRLIRDLKDDWRVEFILTSSDPTQEPQEMTVKEKGDTGIVKGRFSQLKPGKYQLKVEIFNAQNKSLKTITHNQIWILEKSVALIGDDIFSGVGQAVVTDGSLDENLFTFPSKIVEGTDKTYGIDAYTEQAYRDQDRLVFPLNLAWEGQTPGQFLDTWEEDGRKNYVFSLDGQRENESFLGVDEFWIGFFHTSLARGLAVPDYMNELKALVDELLKRGISGDQIYVVEPPFSVDQDMKDYVIAIREKVPSWGVKLGPPVYENTRDEYGRVVDFQREPQFTQLGMQKLASWLALPLVEEDLLLETEN